MVNLIDIGARGKLPNPWKRKYINRLLLCDASIKMRKNGKCRVLKKCIYNDNEVRLFYYYKKADISSLFKPNFPVIKKLGGNTDKYSLIKTQEVECIRLDSLLSVYKESYQFIKCDTQGADLAVLQGMGNFIDDMIGVHCECFLAPLYKDIPSFYDICSFLDGHGLKPSRIIRRPEAWADILFVRDEKSKVRKLIDKLYSRYESYNIELLARNFTFDSFGETDEA